MAFVAAAIALGVSIGVDFSSVLDGPDLFSSVRSVEATNLPEDVRAECLEGVEDHERPRPGDWLAIWGGEQPVTRTPEGEKLTHEWPGSATSANLTIQLAKLAGLKVAVVVDVAKHGARLSNHRAIRPDLLVDSHDPKRAISILQANTRGRLRFGLDTRGKESAAHLLEALSAGNPPAKSARGDGLPPSPPAKSARGDGLPPSPPHTPDANASARAHLIGMTGLPKGPAPEGIQFHAVPIKLFHEAKEVGGPLAMWLGRLLEEKMILPADIIDIEEGLGGVNKGLHRMRRGEISGGKLVVRV
ncbi:hypothetical protein IMZ48_16100 [Candidatus Bathyarchaeota archaeon]|nr:hypothetical protein [Candidatus Bathyarchaeota archaeon]